MNISSKELARQLDVSPATVSMVLNNKPGISKETRELILQAAKEHGFDEKRAGVFEATQHSFQLIYWRKHGKVMRDTPFFSQVTEGITRECAANNCILNISYIYETMDIRTQIRQILSHGCSGILIMATEMEKDDFRWFDDVNIPIVVLDSCFTGIGYDCVLINNFQGAYDAVRHLLDSGHHTIGHLRSAAPIRNFTERAYGYYAALSEAGAEAESSRFIHDVTPTSEEGYLEMMEFLRGKPELPDAYFADNDIIAAAAMKAFHDSGYHLPEDVSIIGFDNMPLCDIMVPPLSTMNVRKRGLGATAVKRLIERIRHPECEICKIQLDTRLVERESVRKA